MPFSKVFNFASILPVMMLFPFKFSVVLSFLAMSALFAPDVEQQALAPLKIKLQLVCSGLVSPVGMASPSDGTRRLFVIEQGGKIKIVKNGVLLPTPFLNISDRLDRLNIAYSEKGLLGLAFHPAYKSNGRFFVYYSAPSQDKKFDHQSIVAEYQVTKTNADLADLTEQVIMKIPEPEGNHNGGCLQFGKDGFLYIGLGDGGGAGDHHGSTGNGQNLNTWLGKILRIDVDSKRPYAVPPDNPFVDRKDAKPEIYAFGLRNPWRFSFDRVTGTLYCADVGQDSWEEIDIIEKGKNYGWRITEGKHCFNPSTGCNTNGLTFPIDEYGHDVGVSICGGFMYRGQMYPSLHGNYLFGDWSGKMFYLRQDKNRSWKRGDVLADGKHSNDIGAKINSMGEDENGEIYVITQHLFGPRSPTGSMYRIGF